MSVTAVMSQHLHKLKEPCDASAQSVLKQPPFGNQSKHVSPEDSVQTCPLTRQAHSAISNTSHTVCEARDGAVCYIWPRRSVSMYA